MLVLTFRATLLRAQTKEGAWLSMRLPIEFTFSKLLQQTWSRSFGDSNRCT
jgi:hypothetical protein